jgi:hypothetical protein
VRSEDHAPDLIGLTNRQALGHEIGQESALNSKRTLKAIRPALVSTQAKSFEFICLNIMTFMSRFMINAQALLPLTFPGK